jgi:signal peptidase II
MRPLLIAAILVPLLDQGVKRLVIARIGQRPLSLGALGELRVVRAQIWSGRAAGRLSLRAMWLVWAAAAVAAVPALGWAFGLLVGGALSHALETWLRGSVCDYVCLRFCPAFDLADVALTAGAAGVAYELLASLS